MSNLLESEEKGFESTEGGEASRERESFSFSSRFSPSRTLPVFFFFSLSYRGAEQKPGQRLSLCFSHVHSLAHLNHLLLPAACSPATQRIGIIGQQLASTFLLSPSSSVSIFSLVLIDHLPPRPLLNGF